MAREKFQTLTEQMFYILLSFQNECCGVDVMEKVKRITDERIIIGPGTLYTLISSFEKSKLIKKTAVEGRKISYILTDLGLETLNLEFARLQLMVIDYKNNIKGNCKEERQ